MSTTDRLQAASWPVRLRPSGTPESGFLELQRPWADFDATERLGAVPRSGHYAVDIDYKGENANPSHEVRLRDLAMLRRLASQPGAELLAHVRSKSLPADPLHGHWWLRGTIPADLRIGADRHESGHFILPRKRQARVRWPGYSVREPFKELARALGAVLAEAPAGYCNDEASRWAWWFGLQGVPRRVAELVAEAPAEVWDASGANTLANTVRSQWEKGDAERVEEAAVEVVFTRLADLPEELPPPPDMVGLFSSRHRVFVAGKKQTGKTTLLGAAAAWHIMYNGGFVVWINSELGPAQLRRFLVRAGVPAIGDSLWTVSGDEWLLAPEVPARVVELANGRPVWTAIDSGTRMGSGIDDEDWQRFQEEAKLDVLHALGGVAVIEHTAHSAPHRLPGDRGKEAWADSIFIVKRRLDAVPRPDGLLHGTMRVYADKDREMLLDGNDFQEVTWTGALPAVEPYDPEDRSDNPAAKARAAKQAAKQRNVERARELKEGGMSNAAIAEEVGVSRATVGRWLQPSPDQRVAPAAAPKKKGKKK